ncbi:hypothetical protein [Clostridium sp. chh4-2]|uniref:hypothetical protein n=1 Tax=Clostridium sp. chh4-2 TaxID=2067550 RepID=UPI001FA8364B|nr:hypothetical protein [Clostridium sp. chh4-2]
MAISKSSALVNQYREYSIAIDSYENKKIIGRIYHASRDTAIPFEGLIEMARFMECIFDEINYPMPSMDQRNFNKIKNLPKMEVKTSDYVGDTVVKGGLMTVKLSIKHRYNASWQGIIKFVESGEEYGFISFLELVKLLNKHLQGETNEEDQIKRESLCRITVDEYDSHCLEGNIHQISSEKRFCFSSTIQLMEHMERMLAPDQESSKVVNNQALGVYRGKGKMATFVIRILFQQNATWQGRICWKDSSQIMNFRSFLELIKLIDSALLSVEMWNDEEGKKEAK